MLLVKTVEQNANTNNSTFDGFPLGPASRFVAEDGSALDLCSDIVLSGHDQYSFSPAHALNLSAENPCSAVTIESNYHNCITSRCGPTYTGVWVGASTAELGVSSSACDCSYAPEPGPKHCEAAGGPGAKAADLSRNTGWEEQSNGTQRWKVSFATPVLVGTSNSTLPNGSAFWYPSISIPTGRKDSVAQHITLSDDGGECPRPGHPGQACEEIMITRNGGLNYTVAKKVNHGTSGTFDGYGDLGAWLPHKKGAVTPKGQFDTLVGCNVCNPTGGALQCDATCIFVALLFAPSDSDNH